MLSKKAKYAIKAVECLAEAGSREPVLIADLARARRIPKKFLERILNDLKMRGILQSRKGKGGGYLLARPAEDISLGEILRAMDGPLAPVDCVSKTAYRSCAECLDEASCGIRLVMKEVRDAIAGILDHVSVAEMLRREQAVRHPLGWNYDI